MIELSVILIIILILDDVETGFKEDFTLTSTKASISILKNKKILLLIPLVITLGILYDYLDEKTKVVN